MVPLFDSFLYFRVVISGRNYKSNVFNLLRSTIFVAKLWGIIQKANLDSSARINVEFKPSKRMKKRRELDALVGVGKSRRKSSNSGHELLRSNGSESSDEDVYRVTPHRA